MCRSYFDALVTRLERLMFELSLAADSGDGEFMRLLALIDTADLAVDCTERIRGVIQRLASIGLLSTTASRSHSRQPSFVQPLLPGLLAHLHPPAESPLPPYPASFLPSLLLALPASTLAALTENLLLQLPSRLPSTALEPEAPSEMVHRLVSVMQSILGPAVSGGEAWIAMLQCVSAATSQGDPTGIDEHMRARMTVGWIRTGGDAGASSIRRISSSY